MLGEKNNTKVELVKHMYYVKYNDGSYAGYVGRTPHFACARMFETGDDANNHAIAVYTGYPYEIKSINTP